MPLEHQALASADSPPHAPVHAVSRRRWLQQGTLAGVALVLSSCGLEQPPQPVPPVPRKPNAPALPHLDELDGESLLEGSFRVSHKNEQGQEWSNDVSVIPETLGFRVGDNRHDIQRIIIPMPAKESIAVSASLLLGIGSLKDVRREGNDIVFLAEDGSGLNITVTQFAAFCRTLGESESDVSSAQLAGNARLNGGLKYMFGEHFSGTCTVETLRSIPQQQLASRE